MAADERRTAIADRIYDIVKAKDPEPVKKRDKAAAARNKLRKTRSEKDGTFDKIYDALSAAEEDWWTPIVGAKPVGDITAAEMEKICTLFEDRV